MGFDQKQQLKKVLKRLSMWVLEDIPKNTTTFLTLPTFHVAL